MKSYYWHNYEQFCFVQLLEGKKLKNAREIMIKLFKIEL